MSRKLKLTSETARKVKEGNRQLDEGSYHGQIVDGWQDEKDGTDVFEFEALAGTMDDCIGIKKKFYFRDDEAGSIKLAKFCIAAGLLPVESLEEGAEIDFDPICEKLVGTQMCITLRKGSYRNDDGETKDCMYADFINTDAPEAKDIPKDEIALVTAPKVNGDVKF